MSDNPFAHSTGTKPCGRSWGFVITLCMFAYAFAGEMIISAILYGNPFSIGPDPRALHYRLAAGLTGLAVCATAAVIGGGLIPIIYWAIRRFREESLKGFAVWWFLLTTLWLWLQYMGTIVPKQSP